MKRIVYVLGTLWLTGCYTYVPAQLGQLNDGERVRAILNEDAGRKLAGDLNEPVASVSGFIDQKTPDALSINVDYYRTVSGGQIGIGSDNRPVTFSLSQIAGVQTRKLSTGRTILFVAGLIATGALAGVLIAAGRAGNPPGQTGNPPPHQ